MTATAVAQIPESTNRVAFKTDIERWVPQLAPFCRPGFTSDRLIAGAVQAGVKEPKLFQCQPASIFLALVKCARLGLDIGESGMWLVPLKDKKTDSLLCEAWTDYRAYKVLAQRARMIRGMDEYEVYAGDDFDYQLGLHPYLTHKPERDPKKRGQLIGAYSVINRPNRPGGFHFLSIFEIEQRRAKSRSWGPKDYSVCPPWWAKKAVVRDYFGRQPKTGEMVLALESDDEDPPANLDAATGELLDGSKAVESMRQLDPASLPPFVETPAAEIE